MSQENVKIVRAFIDALNREDLEAAFKHMDSDVEFDASRTIGPVHGVFKLDQIRAALDEFFGMWEAVRIEIDEFIEADDQVAMSHTSYLRGRDGIEVTVRPCFLWTFRDGRIVHCCFYQEWQEALEAVGLSEQAMSQENVEIIRKAAEVFNAEGPEAAARRFFAEDVEFHDPPESPSPRVARGREEVRKQFNSFNEAWEKHRTDPKEIRAVGTDKVLLFSVEHFTGRDGIEVKAPAAALFTLRDGKIIRWEAFWEKQRALEAAGLKE